MHAAFLASQCINADSLLHSWLGGCHMFALHAASRTIQVAAGCFFWGHSTAFVLACPVMTKPMSWEWLWRKRHILYVDPQGKAGYVRMYHHGQKNNRAEKGNCSHQRAFCSVLCMTKTFFLQHPPQSHDCLQWSSAAPAAHS